MTAAAVLLRGIVSLVVLVAVGFAVMFAAGAILNFYWQAFTAGWELLP